MRKLFKCKDLLQKKKKKSWQIKTDSVRENKIKETKTDVRKKKS